MLRQCSIRLGVILLMAAAFVLPALANAEEAIVITSDTLLADRERSTAVFEGSVVARRDEMVLSADRMTVLYTGDAVSSIIAEGAVKLVKGLQVLTSNRAVYDVSAKTMTFTDGPRAVDEGNVMMGDSIVYYLDEERIKVLKSTLIIESLGESDGDSEGTGGTVE